jgi:hypothetical protein
MFENKITEPGLALNDKMEMNFFQRILEIINFFKKIQPPPAPPPTSNKMVDA